MTIITSNTPPTIRIQASVSPSSLSISDLFSQPVYLHVTAHLLNSDTPITFDAGSMALTLDQPYIGILWFLQDVLTQKKFITSTVHALVSPGATVNLDEDNIVTLFPGQPFQRRIKMGPLPTKRNAENSNNENPQQTHHICGTSLSRFEIGHKYKILLRKMPFSMPWYMKEAKKDIEQRLGTKRGFHVARMPSHSMAPKLEYAEDEAPAIEING